MFAVYKKEMLNYFKTPIAYIFIAPFLFLSAMFFVQGLGAYMIYQMQGQSLGIEDIFSNLLGSTNIICLFIVPILTMQLFSEERSKKTDQLLLTSPVSVPEIVAGKYFAALSVFLVALIISFILPVILFIIGKPVATQIVGSYIGFIFIWTTFIAIGVFISSLTESQVISAILSFVSLLVLYLLDGMISGIEQEWLKNLIGWFSVFKRYADFQVGLLNLPNIIYYLSFIFTFLFLTYRNIEKRRYS